MGGNIFQSVEKAEGEYSWIIGNDEMMLPYTFKKLSEIFKLNKEVDFFYINSYSIDSELILNNEKPIDFFNITKLLTKPTTVNLFGIKLIEYYFTQPKISIFSTRIFWPSITFITNSIESSKAPRIINILDVNIIILTWY